MDLKHKTRYGTAAMVITLIGACGMKEQTIRDPLEYNLVLSGENRPELEKVLAHYREDPSDSLKLKAAIFLISNMEDKVHYDGEWLRRYDSLFSEKAAGLNEEQTNKLKDSIKLVLGSPGKEGIRKIIDLQALSSSFLINNIDVAFLSWQKAPWKSQISFDAFCNYILPYKEYNEYPEEWRNKLYDRYKDILEDPHVPMTMEDIVCAQVEEQKTWMQYSDEALGDYPGALNMGQILKIRKGGCIEFSSLGALAARAFGMPVAVDFVFGHNWDALILSDRHFVTFEGAESRPGDHNNLREADSKFTKVYRRHAAWVPGSFAARAREAGIKTIPEVLNNPRLIDVTASYTPSTDLVIHVKGRDGSPVYLCPFIKHDFEARAGGFINNNQVLFRQTAMREVYIPMFYNKGRYEPAAAPVMVPVHGEKKDLIAGQEGFGTMTLDRRYPFKRWMEWILETPMISARFEADHDPGFQHPVLLHEIKYVRRPYQGRLYNDLDHKDRFLYDSIWKQTIINSGEHFRYVRLVFKKGNPLKLGELQFYTQGEQQPLTGKPIGNIPEPGLAFDGVPGRSIKLETDTSGVQWVGLDLGEKRAIEKIRYIAADDSHVVESGKRYELFYWKDKWVSAGAQQAIGLSLVYDQVPQGGLYLLRCYDCINSDERPFTYENGKQVWW